MDPIQLDECINSERLHSECLKEGLVDVYRFPPELKTKAARLAGRQKDREVLPIIFGQGRVLLTTDRPIVDDNLSSFPATHPGIIIVGSSRPSPTFAVRDILTLFRQIKKDLPDWNTLPTRNSVIEITQEWVEVQCVQAGMIRNRLVIIRTNGYWKDRLASQLRENFDSADDHSAIGKPSEQLSPPASGSVMTESSDPQSPPA